MRTKTLVRRAKLCRSPLRVKPISTISMRLPVLEMNDDNRENASGSEIGSGRKGEEDDGLTVSSHEGMDVRGESCDNLGQPGVSMDEDWFERETCIKCDEEGQMLVCSVSDCPVAVHEKCLTFKPRLDYMGNFRCPYCWFKQVVEKKRELRKEFMLAKNALSDFTNFKVVEDDPEKMKDGKAKKNGVNTSPLDYHDHKRGVEDEEQAEPSKEEAGLKVPADDREMPEASDPDTQPPLVHRTLTKQISKMKLACKNVDPSKNSSPQIHKTPERRAKNQSEHEITYKRAGQDPKSSYQMNVGSCNGKRKRARWTKEEEDILKEGVERFSSGMNVNFPWRKVLEFGRGVFHSNRTSTDLKDKWRNI